MTPHVHLYHFLLCLNCGINKKSFPTSSSDNLHQPHHLIIFSYPTCMNGPLRYNFSIFFLIHSPTANYSVLSVLDVWNLDSLIAWLGDLKCLNTMYILHKVHNFNSLHKSLMLSFYLIKIFLIPTLWRLNVPNRWIFTWSIIYNLDEATLLREFFSFLRKWFRGSLVEWLESCKEVDDKEKQNDAGAIWHSITQVKFSVHEQGQKSALKFDLSKFILLKKNINLSS